MAFNELEAARMLDDGKLNDEQIKMLTRSRHGLSHEEVRDDKNYKDLVDRGLLVETTLSHPRASITVPVVIPTEAGTTVLNLFDKRFRENTGASPDANTAPDVDAKLVKAPTEEEARKQPHLDMKPLDPKDKPVAEPRGDEKEAMKYPVVRTGGKDMSDAKTGAERVITEDAKIVVDGSKFDHDEDGKVGGSKKKK